MSYNHKMIQILETETFAEWFASLRDREAKNRVLARIRRVELGNYGDCEPVGLGVSELRIHFGPGYRVYFFQRGFELVILLGGGDKNSQQRDIKEAQELAQKIKEEK